MATVPSELHLSRTLGSSTLASTSYVASFGIQPGKLKPTCCNCDCTSHARQQRTVLNYLCRLITIIADDYVDREFGTGALKITPGHDPNDYEIGQRFGLEIINIMNNDGSLNANAGDYAGLDRFDARQKLWADMEVTSFSCCFINM